jgi:hypothetical protein
MEEIIMRIDTIKGIIDGFCYASIEMEGGHISRHIKCEDGFLIDRILSERKELATTFDCSSDEAVELIKTACLDEEWQMPECIKEWLDDESDRDDYAFDFDFDHVIGHGFFKKGWHDWNSGVAYCSRLTVVLRKVELRDGSDTFRVYSAYPTVTEEDIERTKAQSINAMNVRAVRYAIA